MPVKTSKTKKSGRSVRKSVKKNAEAPAKPGKKKAATRTRVYKTRKQKTVEPEEEPETSHGRELAGLVFIAVAIVSTISLLSEFAKGSSSNLLGDYLGEWWASALNLFAGSLPSIIMITAVLVTGIKLIQAPKATGFNFKIPMVLTLVFLQMGILLSVKNIAIQDLTFSHFQESGGYIGNFIVHQVMVPVFGRTRFGPYLITGILMFLTVVWGFKLRIAQVMEKFTELLGIFVFPILDVFDRYRGRKLNLVEVPDHITGALEIPDKVAKKARGRKKNIPEQKVTTLVPIDESQFDNDGSGEETLLNKETPPNISLLEKEEEKNLPTDPIELRKFRDMQATRRRISELNQWEEVSTEPEIGGMIGSAGKTAKNPVTPPPLRPEEEPVLTKARASDVDRPEKVEEQTPDEVEVAGENTDLLRTKDDVYAEGEELAEDEELSDEVEEQDQEPDPEPEEPPEPEIIYDEYVVPELDEVLEDAPEQNVEYTEEELKVQAKALEEQLANFKVMGKVVGIRTGPVVIRYEIELAPGVKVNTINNLSDDLAMALKAKSIRILAPIPGKSAVGIEVPNKQAQIVYIKEILDSPTFEVEEDTLKLVLGKDISGEPSVMDLTKAPHLLIAGQTGSGKSVGINSFMASILVSKTPDEVRMILVDPKVVELKPYDKIPHLLAPVVTEPEVAIQALKWATVEMDNRYQVLAKAGARNIKGFNQKFRAGELSDRVKDPNRKLMPYIVIVIDELADLMMVAGKEVETSIARIAQKARAVGLHLIIATQRPSTNVITGTIKANLPTRIAFQVASQIDARTIMDKAGSEKLLGRGDMLFRSIDSPEPERMHGSFVDDDECEALANSCADQYVNYPHISTFEVEEAEDLEEVDEMPRDSKFREAAELVVSLRQGSVSLLQRRMAIGYARAGRIADQLERAGILGKERGNSKPREVHMNELELESFLSSGLND